MTLAEISYPISPRGLATSFTESETPIDFALKFKNRFINAAGGAEKRQGIQQLGSDVPSLPNLTGLHELVQSDGTEILLASGGGAIYKFDDASTWTSVFSGWDSSARIRSMQMGKKLIFFNGVDRNISTEDATTFEEHRSVVETGIGSNASTSAAGLSDGNISDWVTNTDVVENDILYNRTLDAFGVINTVTTAQVQHTTVGSAADGIGIASRNQESGDAYEIIDGVELNIIDVNGVLDNTGVLASGSDETSIVVSGTDWTQTEVKVGDFVRNTTQVALTQVSAIGVTALTVASVSGQAVSDSIILIKSAMPIAQDGHVHFGRGYMIDARDQKKVRITGAGDSRDLTTDAATLDTASLSFGELQPQGDIALAMDSYQRFFVIGGKENVFLYQGTDPIADTSALSTDFDIIGLFPQGVVSRDGMVSIGNDIVFVTPDGVQTASLAGDASTLGRENISEALKTELRNKIRDASPDQIQVIHYPRRSWMMLKISSEIFIFNYTTQFGIDQSVLDETQGSIGTRTGSWSLFDGKFATQETYFVRRNGDLVCAGAGGKVYKFDVDGVYDDDGTLYETEYQTPWLDLPGARKFHDVRIKTVKYVKPIFDVGADINYTLRLEGQFDVESSEQVVVSAAGGGSTVGTAVIPFTIGSSTIEGNVKYALRARGEQFRLTYTTLDDKGPDTISRYTLYYNYHGRR